MVSKKTEDSKIDFEDFLAYATVGTTVDTGRFEFTLDKGAKNFPPENDKPYHTVTLKVKKKRA